MFANRSTIMWSANDEMTRLPFVENSNRHISCESTGECQIGSQIDSPLSCSLVLTMSVFFANLKVMPLHICFAIALLFYMSSPSTRCTDAAEQNRWLITLFPYNSGADMYRWWTSMYHCLCLSKCRWSHPVAHLQSCENETILVYSLVACYCILCPVPTDTDTRKSQWLFNALQVTAF